MIRVRVPGTLAYRNLALRVVAAASKMIGHDEVEPSPEADAFEAEVVSAVGEAYNNIAMHAYKGVPVGDIDISIDSLEAQVVVEMRDTGNSFDPSVVLPPKLEELPESGMGLFIIRSFIDEVTYTAGPPQNVLRLAKQRRSIPVSQRTPGAGEVASSAHAVIHVEGVGPSPASPTRKDPR